MDSQGKLFGALIVTYFVSRVVLRLPNPLAKAWGITLAHAVSLALIVLALIVLQGSLAPVSTDRLLIYLAPQVLWWLFDLFREHRIVAWRIPGRSGQQAP